MRNFLLMGLLVAIAVTVLYGCDDRKDPFQTADVPPTIKVRTNNLYYTDNLKDTAKKNTDYTVITNIVWSDKVNSIKPMIVTTSGTATGTVKNDSTIVISGFSSGINQLKITAKDYFDKENSALITIQAIDNMIPVARIRVARKNGFAVTFDGSGSYDQDEKWGGKIVSYNWAFDGVACSNHSANITQVFSSGAHLIDLKVQDNDGAWSAFVINKSDTTISL